MVSSVPLLRQCCKLEFVELTGLLYAKPDVEVPQRRNLSYSDHPGVYLPWTTSYVPVPIRNQFCLDAPFSLLMWQVTHGLIDFLCCILNLDFGVVDEQIQSLNSPVCSHL